VRPPSGPERRRAYARISYFMLFRLAMLAFFTVLAGVTFYARATETDPYYATFVWGTLVVGYGLTLGWAYWLPRAEDPTRIASLQTASDILLSAVVVQMTGGVDSGFATLYLISVLGAATMGGPQHTWAAASACMLIYLVMAVLQFLGVATPFYVGDPPALTAQEHWTAVGRTVTGLVGVSVLSSYLNTQLTSSVSQVGNLRALNENIVRSLSSGLLTLDLDDRLVYFNPAGRTLLDLEDELIGKPIDGILPNLPSLEDGFEGRQEVHVITATGRPLRLGLTRTALCDADGDRIGSIINFQDVTPIHELTQRARRNERLAALGGLAASVAHEIRNPLAAISGSAELLGSTPHRGPASDEDQRLLRIIQRESNRLSTLISDLLSYTRPRAPQLAPVDLARVAHEAVEGFRHDPSTHGVRVVVDAPEPVHAEVDAAHVTQVLWNLLRNAAQAIDGPGEIHIGVTGDGEDAELRVRDDGVGIPSEHLELIFDPFFTTKESGTGFGLAFVHRIVGDNGGTIAVESTPGHGTKFTIRFPRYVARPTAADSGVLDLPERP